MKYLYLLLCISLFSTCKKEEAPKFYYGEISMKLNGESYVRDLETFSADPDNPISFNMWLSKTKQMTKDRSFHSESMYIMGEKIFGKQYLRNCDTALNYACRFGVSFYTSPDDGDIMGDRFSINNSARMGNYLEITDEKNEFKEIWGNFQFEMIRDSMWKDEYSPYPDTVRFTEGKFHVYFK